MKQLTLLLLITTIATSIAQAQPFAGGEGTEEDPYQIETVKQLQEILNHTDKHFVQVADIDASETEDWNDGKGFEPIGDDVVKFTGSYDGSGYEIDGLYIDRPDEDGVGLFGYAEAEEIKRVGITNSYVRGGNDVGSLIGRNEGIKISHSYVTGDVTASRFAGGLIGYNRGGDVTGSHATGAVSGNGYVGGLIGYNSGTVTGSHATGDVTASRWAIIDLTGEHDYAGGLIGLNGGDVTGSHATGDVTAKGNTAGGFAGVNRDDAVIENSYSTGSATGGDEVGGFAGVNRDDSVIENSYSTGMPDGDSDVGGFVGLNGATISSSYWDTQSSEKEQGTGRGPTGDLTGLTTGKMTGAAAHDNMEGLDFEETWLLTEGYPALYWEDVESIPLPTSTEEVADLPNEIILQQNYPNPFNPSTQIRFALPEPAHVNLSVYNLIGQQVATLVNENRSPGWYDVTFDASGLSSGVFIYRLEAGDYVETKSMIFVK